MIALFAQAQGPVIPNFGRGDECIRENGNFCVKWFLDNFSDRFWPRVVEHIELTLIAMSFGMVIAFVAALAAYRYGKLELPFANVMALFYTIPSIAFFQVMVPVTFTADRAEVVNVPIPAVALKLPPMLKVPTVPVTVPGLVQAELTVIDPAATCMVPLLVNALHWTKIS